MTLQRRRASGTLASTSRHRAAEREPWTPTPDRSGDTSLNVRIATPTAPPQPFFTTPEQRLALARERFFEEGIRPSGMVSEGVIQSWTRCLQQRRSPDEPIAFDPVTESRMRSALTRSRVLLETAHAELRQLETTLAGTACTVLLTDPHGVVVHATRPRDCHDEILMPLAGRVGVNLAEDSIGTNAPGLTARTGVASVVLGAEHFFGCVQVMRCAAAPIRDMHGQMAGVLDVSSESRPFGFDAVAVVGLFATAIENRLMRAQSTEHIVVHLQTSPSLLNTPMEGLVGIGADGRIAWANGVAARLLGIASFGSGLTAEEVFAVGLRGLASMSRRREAEPHRLPSGLNVWLFVRIQSPDGAGPVVTLGARASEPVDTTRANAPHGSAPSPRQADEAGSAGLLRNSNRHLITQTLEDCGGNVSGAARRLGVSRGLVYRHLKGL